jgi:hypothetical protein
MGIKAGASVNWVKPEDESFLDTVNVNPVPGFDVGGAISFKVKDRYFLHTEYVYSQKGKILKGEIDPDLHDEVKYHHIEVPILFTMHFKGHLSKTREFKWYAGVGPNVSYFLGGNGVINSGEHKENYSAPTEYSIEFGSRKDTYHPEIVFYPEANRFQFGLNFGAGLLFEPGQSNKVMVYFRYEVDQTRIGRSLADYQRPNNYDDNLRSRNRAFKVSIIYMTEFNLDKKSRNKGKSTKRVK